MIAFTPTGRVQWRLPRDAVQRLVDARAAFDRAEYTTAVVLARVAIDTAITETVERIDIGTFARVAAVDAECRYATLRRIQKLLKRANTVVHGGRPANRYEAGRMLRLVEALGARWVCRTYGTRAGDVLARFEAIRDTTTRKETVAQ